MSYAQSHQSEQHGRRYDRELAVGYQGHLWRMRERELISKVVASLALGDLASSALDIACGTGRILSIEASIVDEVVGVDVSGPMLEACAERVSGATLIEASIGDFDPGRTFGIVSAFRFFTNAEPALRDEAASAAYRLLQPAGVFLTNVHLQVTSPGGAARWAARAATRSAYPRAYHWRAHRRRLESHGFRVERMLPYGFLPNVGKVAPKKYMQLNAALERTRGVTALRSLHDSVLFVARRLG